MPLEHPDITRINRYGYIEEDIEYGEDDLGNTVYVGETILGLDHMFFLKHALDDRLLQVFYELGADEKIAGN